MKILGLGIPGVVPMIGEKKPRSLAGKVVVVTGGGRGIGAETARALLDEGARVVLGDIDLDVAQDTARRLGPAAVARYLDVTDRAGFTAFLNDVETTVGPIDVLINNAGIMPVGLLEDESDAATGRQLEINLHAVIHGTREAIARMKPRGHGHIVNVASMAGKGGFPGVATYCATKFGVVGFTEAVRFELRGSGIDLSCVMPVIVKTELGSGLPEARGVKSLQPEDVAAAIVAALKYQRFDVYVPGYVGLLTTVANTLPRPGREALARFLRADSTLVAGIGAEERAAYEKRASESAPTLAAEEGRRLSTPSQLD